MPHQRTACFHRVLGSPCSPQVRRQAWARWHRVSPPKAQATPKHHLGTLSRVLSDLVDFGSGPATGPLPLESEGSQAPGGFPSWSRLWRDPALSRSWCLRSRQEDRQPQPQTAEGILPPAPGQGGPRLDERCPVSSPVVGTVSTVSQPILPMGGPERHPGTSSEDLALVSPRQPPGGFAQSRFSYLLTLDSRSRRARKQGLCSGSLCQHENISLCVAGGALQGAGHPVACIHIQERLAVGHSCAGTARGAVGAGSWCPPGLSCPWEAMLPSAALLGKPGLSCCRPHPYTLLTPPEGCQWEAGWCSPKSRCTSHHWGHCRGPSTWIGYLTPAENLMKEDPEGPDVGFDGSKALGRGPWGRSACRGCCGRGKGRCPPATKCAGWVSAAAHTPPAPTVWTGTGSCGVHGGPVQPRHW